MTENGAPAHGSYVVRGPGLKSEGTCGTSIDLPAGAYEVSVKLDSRESAKTQSLRIQSGASTQYTAAFETASVRKMVSTASSAMSAKGEGELPWSRLSASQ